MANQTYKMASKNENEAELKLRKDYLDILYEEMDILTEIIKRESLIHESELMTSEQKLYLIQKKKALIKVFEEIKSKEYFYNIFKEKIVDDENNIRATLKEMEVNLPLILDIITKKETLNLFSNESKRQIENWIANYTKFGFPDDFNKCFGYKQFKNILKKGIETSNNKGNKTILEINKFL